MVAAGLRAVRMRGGWDGGLEKGKLRMVTGCGTVCGPLGPKTPMHPSCAKTAGPFHCHQCLRSLRVSGRTHDPPTDINPQGG